MASKIPGLQIIGGSIDKVEACTTNVDDGNTFAFGCATVTCLLTPGHTNGHMSYYVTTPDGKPGHVFTGDCLFIGGCGRFFEGSPSQMYDSLYSKIAHLPDDTNVWVGHEYTVSNYRFALSVEPDNPSLVEASASAVARRSKGLPTIPSTIALEKATNVFMRCEMSPTVISACNCSASSKPFDVLGKLRQKKDTFR
eukprot:FR734996.1.p1 GENE.FR734996.1~~FR734996.1.p1  ORF type:complete len:218 (+),score=10.39 FR734996.1:67-654(+)